MFRMVLLVLACLAFSAQANSCCGSYAERSDCCSRPAQYVVEEAPAAEYVEEPEVEPAYEAPAPAHYENPAPAPAAHTALVPKITIEITQTPQPVTEPAPKPTPAPVPAPARYQAPVDRCGNSGCGEEVKYVQLKKLVPVRRERLQRVKVRPVHKARYVEEAAPCSTVCRASAGCCQ